MTDTDLAIAKLIDSDPVALGVRCRNAERERDHLAAQLAAARTESETWRARAFNAEKEATMFLEALKLANVPVPRLAGSSSPFHAERAALAG